MRLDTQLIELRLKHRFTIARGSQDSCQVVVAALSEQGLTGLGEASPSSFYGETAQTVAATLEERAAWLGGRDLVAYRHLLDEAGEALGKQRATLCALDLAVHDWVGKRWGLPLHRLLGLSPGRLPPTSFTIGIDTVEAMLAKVDEARGYPILKIKLGTADDLGIVRALRAKTGAVLRVDANCAWTVQEAIEKSRELKALGVEFLEQPLPPEALEGMEEVCARSAIPVFADESSVVPEDVPALRGKFHGINIKLVKCGGIRPALRMIELARTLGLRIMIGCMIESSLACTAAAQIGALVDHLDIDGCLLIGNDPFEGARYSGGDVRLPEGPGLGVSYRSPTRR